MWRFTITIARLDDSPLRIASGVIFADGITMLRWEDGSGAYGLYPNETVLDTITTPDGAAVVVDLPDGDPRPDLAHQRAHAIGQEHHH